MKHFIIFLFAIIVVSNCKSQTITPNDAKDYVGQNKTVCGEVANCFQSLRSKGQPTFLDMGGKYPASTFTVLIWGENLSKFRYDLKTLEGKNICVTGYIKDYRGKPEIVVSNPSQIKSE